MEKKYIEAVRVLSEALVEMVKDLQWKDTLLELKEKEIEELKKQLKEKEIEKLMN